MKKNLLSGLLGLLIVIVIGLALLPTVADSAQNYDIISTTETFTALSDDATIEAYTLANTPTPASTVTSVKVNGVLQVITTDYTVAGAVVTTVADTSNVGDSVAINYSYQLDAGTGIDSLIGVMPLLFTVIILGGVVGFIVFRNKN